MDERVNPLGVGERAECGSEEGRAFGDAVGGSVDGAIEEDGDEDVEEVVVVDEAGVSRGRRFEGGDGSRKVGMAESVPVIESENSSASSSALPSTDERVGVGVARCAGDEAGSDASEGDARAGG